MTVTATTTATTSGLVVLPNIDGTSHWTRRDLPPISFSAPSTPSSAMEFRPSHLVFEGTAGPEPARMGPVSVLGEPFYVVVEDGRFYVEHDQWSLLGAGDSLPDALWALFEQSKALAPALASMDRSTFTPEAIRLLEFVSRIR